MNIEKFTHKYEKLTRKFECGNIIINNFLKNGDALDENQGITYVLLSDKKDVIILKESIRFRAAAKRAAYTKDKLL